MSAPDDVRPGSWTDYYFINKAVDTYLRTHRGGVSKLIELIGSVPPDRTEEEYAAEGRERGKAAAKRAAEAAAIRARQNGHKETP